MGCINSTNKHIYALKRDDVFNASVVRVQSEQSVALARHGLFEISPQELIFISSDHEPISWALQHLRRYGLNGNIFSFEAGRRCRTGPGIYTFRCYNADQFYAKFQRCINSMPVFGERGNSSIHPSHLFVRLDTHIQNTNHYLEPTSAQLPSLADERTFLTESNSNDSNDYNLNSPVSMQSSSLTAEMINFTSTVPPYSNISPNQKLFFSGSNIYMEQPVRPNQERNNNISAEEGSELLSSNKNNSEVKIFFKSSSLDIPPEECAPILAATGMESQRVNAKTDLLANASTSQSLCNNLSDRCYANVEVSSRIDNTIASSMQINSFQLESGNEQLQQTTFSTPVVNYIILDLDQPRSPSQCSPKNVDGSSHSSSSMENVYNIKKEDISSNTASIWYGSSTMPKGSTIHDDSEALSNNVGSSGSYTRIDFLKTFALMKSSNNYTDLELDNDQEESRITRHSKFVRKAYSISE